MNTRSDNETFEKCSNSFKFNVQIRSSSRKTKNLTGGIYGIFRGLNFESDAEIGQKGAFFKGLS